MKPRVVAIVLALFLGGFGAHKFYMNQAGSGVIRFLFCWTMIPAAIALVEVIMYATMTDAKWEAKYRRE